METKTKDAPLVATRMPHDEAAQYGLTFAKSRLFVLKETPLEVVPHKLAAIVMAGHELGFAPFTSIAGISIVEGKPRLSYQLLGALVRRSGRYDYRIQELNAERASVEFLELDLLAADPKERWRSLGVSTFTLEDAKLAELYPKKDNWRKYPKNMLFARALSQGVNFFCPDVAAGCPVYAEEDDAATQRDVPGQLADSSRALPAEQNVHLAYDPGAEKPNTINAPAPEPAKEPPKGQTPITVIPIATTATQAAGATIAPSQTASAIVRADGTSVPLDHASAAIETARQDEAQAAKPARKPRAKKGGTLEEKLDAAVPGLDASKSPSEAKPATVPDPKPEPAPIAAALGVTAANAPAALAPDAPKPDAKPTAPLATEKQAHPDAPSGNHPGAAAFQLSLDLSKLDPAKPVEGKLAAKAHVCGVNFYGSDKLAREAWRAVGYALPKKGDKVNAPPTASQVDAYLARIVEQAEQKERVAQEPASEIFGDNTSDL